ncbi:MAG: UbiH/UbiF/VisC/COQ6 family ubiquinone biosynthesis hydroxylase [Rhodospirillales bacterium]|nr:UbiH/UbiF/VisC/COQ6 family ubiquinone biosynthesis hydroxylase [Rhodospirillales bacterium]
MPDPGPSLHLSDAHVTGQVDLRADVLIVGSGLVGSALACALGQCDVDIVVVDAVDAVTVTSAAYDGRASAIALSSRRLLEAVGVWQHVAETATPMLDIRVSEGGSPMFLHYDHEAVGGEPFGHMVENRILRSALFARMDVLPSVRLLAPARVAHLERTEAGVAARLADGGRVRARLAVAADGRGSQIRESAGIGVTRWNYAQVGIVCTVAHQRPHNNIAHEHFLPAGPFAILPITGNRSSIVWTERADLAPMIMALDDGDFTAELAKRFGDFLGTVAVEGRRWCYPLSLQFARTATAERLALVGDAYHGMHPIAGQGLNMGFRDVAALAEAVVDCARFGGDIGGGDVLTRYQQWRRFDNHLMLAMTDGLNRLFSNDVGPIKLARNLGLATVNQIPPLKSLFMRHAMGVVGELPRLMRGEAL